MVAREDLLAVFPSEERHKSMRNQRETEELVRITEQLQATIGHGKCLERLNETDIQEVVAQLARVRQITQGDFSASLKDGRMSVRIRQEDKGRQGEWVLTWLDDGYPSITNDMGMSQLPDFVFLPFRAHVEFRKRLSAYGYQYFPSESFSEYIEKNPGDGGIEFLENAGPRFIAPYARPYFLRFYPDWTDETPPADS